MTAVMESPTASASSRITAAADSARYALEEASAETSSATDVPKATASSSVVSPAARRAAMARASAATPKS